MLYAPSDRGKVVATGLLHQRQPALRHQIVANQRPGVAYGVGRESHTADDGVAGDTERDAMVNQRVDGCPGRAIAVKVGRQSQCPATPRPQWRR